MPIAVHKPETDWEFNGLLADAPKNAVIAINFHTPWAEPCKQMNQAFSEIAQSLPDETKAVFVSVDAEELPDVSEKYEVAAVPLVVLCRDGAIQASISGPNAKALKENLDKLLGLGGQATTLPPVQKVEANASSAAAGPTEEHQEEEEEEEEDLNTRLSKLVKAAPVMLFMKGTPAAPQCGFSRQIVALLRERGVRYGFFNILADEEVRQGLKKFSEWPTYPQLYVSGELIGGLDIVKEEIENDPEFLKNVAA